MDKLVVPNKEKIRFACCKLHNGVEEKLKQNNNDRDNKWTESIGVGNKSFLKTIKEKLGDRDKGRIVEDKTSSTYQLREPRAVYGVNGQENLTNTYHWDI